MIPPKPTNRFVRVTAYMTDEAFGYEHWRAAQFASPDVAVKRSGVLIICESEAEQVAALAYLRNRAEEKGERA
jgi:hypothetical protein